MSRHAQHPIDRAVALERGDGGVFHGQTSPDYANMVGPFGGTTAATMLNSVLLDPRRLGDPVALTVNYAGPVVDGRFAIRADALRTNRSTQHWSVAMSQADQICTSATAFFATRRDTWTHTETGFPEVPPAGDLARFDNAAMPPWTRCYDMRFVTGGRPSTGQGVDELDSLSMLWIRDEPPRPLDFVSLTAICDSFFPRIIIRRPQWVPAGTVSLTVYFHADAAQLQRHGAGPLLGVAKASHFGLGYHDQTAEIWSAAGDLLATSHQIVYFKE
ncbi:MAG: thioesterase family protein [Burkholderiaceae bacterium]